MEYSVHTSPCTTTCSACYACVDVFVFCLCFLPCSHKRPYYMFYYVSYVDHVLARILIDVLSFVSLIQLQSTFFTGKKNGVKMRNVRTSQNKCQPRQKENKLRDNVRNCSLFFSSLQLVVTVIHCCAPATASVAFATDGYFRGKTDRKVNINFQPI